MSETANGEFDIGPAGEMQRKYGWYAENRPEIIVNVEEVPPHLRDLIPYVERWAIRCDITRQDFFAKSPDEDIRKFADAVAPRRADISAWLNTLPAGVENWPETAVHYLFLLKAWCDAACWFGPEG
jgi:hypothetical protein